MKRTSVILSAITAFLIGMGSSLTAVIVEAKGNLPSGASWLVIIFGALAVSAKDVRSLLKLPPVTDQGDTAILKNASKKLPLLLLCGLLVSCGTTPEERVQSAADVARFCAYNASEALLIEKPQAEPGLRVAANQLRALETRESVKMTEILLIVGQLPPDQLRSPYGRLAIANGTMLLTRLGRSTDLATVDLKPIATGLREGIELRIGPPPQ